MVATTSVKTSNSQQQPINNSDFVSMTDLGQKIEQVVNETLQKAEPFFTNFNRVVREKKGFQIDLSIHSFLKYNPTSMLHSEFFSDGKTASETFLKAIHFFRDNKSFQKMPSTCVLTMKFRFQYFLKTLEAPETVIPNLSSTGFTIPIRTHHDIQVFEKQVAFLIENPDSAASTTATTSASQSAATIAQK